MRWKARIAAGEEPAKRPGPKKVEAINFDTLRIQVERMKHGSKRTAGFSSLYTQYRDGISRRDLAGWVAEERARQTRMKRQSYGELIWKAPGMIWAMDDTEYRPDPAQPKLYLHDIQDMASRYKLEPQVTRHLLKRTQVAENLHRLMEVHGPPLFLKMDNGGNLNNPHVEQVLKDRWVLPLNSPCHYPQFNGGIERAHREIKERLATWMPPALLPAHIQLETQRVNFQPKPCLGMQCPWQVFQSRRPLAAQFTKRRRKEIYEKIKENTLLLIESGEYSEDDAWREAVQTWLLENHFIAFRHQPGVLPDSFSDFSHN